MGTGFSWGFPDASDNNEGAPNTPSQADVDALFRDSLRNSAASSYFPLQNADPTAQTSAGLGIQNIKRAFTAKSTTDGNTVYTPTELNDTWTEVYPSVLSTQITCSGRPLMVFIRGTFAHLAEFGNRSGRFEARVDKSTALMVQPADAIENGTIGFPTEAFGVAQVPAGTHTFSMWARSYFPVLAGQTGPSLDGSLGYYLTVVEI